MIKKMLFILLIILLFLTTVEAAAVRELTGDKLDFSENEQGQIFTAVGNVNLLYDQLKVTAAGQGIYYRYSGQLDFQDDVELFYQEYQGAAQKLTGNVNQQVYHLQDQAELTTAEAEVSGDQIDFYQLEQRVEASGNVYLKYQDFWAEADQATYYLDRKFMILTGNVRGARNGQKFTSDSAEVNQLTNQVKLKGQAKLTLPAESTTSDSAAQDSPSNEQGEN